MDLNLQRQNNNGKNGWQSRKERGASRKVDLGNMVYGKVPPQALDLETAVLGAIMLERGAFDLVCDFLKAESFYMDAHKRIYAAAAALTDRSQPVDILTVVEELRRRGELDQVGGPYFVSKLTNEVTSSANIEAHARIVHQKFIQRELIRISGEMLTAAYEDTADVFDLLDQAENDLFSVSTGHLKSDYTKADVLYEKVTTDLERRLEVREEITGVPSGFVPLDKTTFGWQPTDFIVIAARPSVGKTAFALNLARNAALNPEKPTGVGIFSLEMSKAQVMQRLVSAQSGIQLRKIRQGKMETAELQQLHRQCVHTIAMAPIYIDDTAALNIFELRAKARRMVHNNGVGLLIIDYLQLMSGVSEDGRTGNREQEISKISRALKALAKELNVPVIALSQMSRDIEKRKGPPQLSDLRESGAIEQDTDFVGFLLRSDYQKSDGEIDPSISGDAELWIRKHRNGQLETIAFKTDLSTQRFLDIDAVNADQREARFITRKEAEARFSIETPPPPPDDLDNELPF